MASAVKVTPKQCPDLHAKLQIACTTLGVDMPDLYIHQNPIVNAFTGGVEKPIIVLHSALIERLNEEETLAVIAHEVGHIHAEHVLYLTAARLLEALANLSIARLIPGSEILKFIISAGIAGALLAWARRAELSCDRAGLLVVQDPHVIGRTMMKLAGGTLRRRSTMTFSSNRDASSKRITMPRNSTNFGQILSTPECRIPSDLAHF
jgi:Zn-dependent protease with chaperone function